MASIKPPSDHKTVNLKLAETIKNLPEDQQLILLKQLLKGNLTATLFRASSLVCPGAVGVMDA